MMRRSLHERRGILLLALGLAGVMMGCAGDVGPPDSPPNVILLMVDTLRADHLGVYGYDRDISPNLDRFARSNVLFTRARSQAACTFPSVNSLLTSIYPTPFLVQDEYRFGIPEAIPTLAELLAAQGFQTLAVSASPIVRKSPSRRNPDGGFDRGFQGFEEACQWKEADCINARALELLDSLQEPFFLYLHYMDPHDPYSPPASFPRRFATESPDRDFIARGDPTPIERMIYAEGPSVDFTEKDRRHLIDLYDEEIAYFDLQFQTLLDELQGRALRNHSIVVVASDHGEELLEHGHIKHCRTLFDASTRTPLAMSIPGVQGPIVVNAAVENIDIMPTLLDYLGLELPDLALDGDSLRPLIEGTSSEKPMAFSLHYPYCSVDDGRYKLVLHIADGSRSLYDLKTDPCETRDLIDEAPSHAQRLSTALAQWLRTQVGTAQDRVAPGAYEGSFKRLQALGYLQ